MRNQDKEKVPREIGWDLMLSFVDFHTAETRCVRDKTCIRTDLFFIALQEGLPLTTHYHCQGSVDEVPNKYERQK